MLLIGHQGSASQHQPIWGFRGLIIATRHSSATDTSNVTFTLTLDTVQGNYTIPQLGGALSMAGYDSKVFDTLLFSCLAMDANYPYP